MGNSGAYCLFGHLQQAETVERLCTPNEPYARQARISIGYACGSAGAWRSSSLRYQLAKSAAPDVFRVLPAVVVRPGPRAQIARGGRLRCWLVSVSVMLYARQ